MPYVDDVKTIWEMVKESFRPQMIDSAIDLWFGEIEVISFENNLLTLGTNSELKYDIITKYSSLWQDSIRNGEFILTNTNRLVRFYDGCNGLKTGSTDKAGFCISVTAE